MKMFALQLPNENKNKNAIAENRGEASNLLLARSMLPYGTLHDVLTISLL